MKFILSFLLLSIALITSQWLSQVWLLKKINLSNQLFTNQLSTSTQEITQHLSTQHSTDDIQKNISAIQKNTITTAGTPENTEFREEITLLIHQEIGKALKANLNVHLANNLKENNRNIEPVIESNESKDAYYSSLDIAAEARSYGTWDESTNMKLSEYKDKLSRTQKNLIVHQYIQAFNDGLISPTVSPPF